MGILNSLPSWVVFIITAIITFLAFEGGFVLARKRKSEGSLPKAPVGSIIGATLGLLAFVLAFTFGLAASRFQERIMLVVQDANVIETAYLRANFLPISEQSEVKKLIHEYVQIREPNSKKRNFQQVLNRSEVLLNQLWEQAVIFGKNNPHSVMAGLFVNAINEMVDVHSKRIALSTKIKIPYIIWAFLYLVTILSMVAVGFYSGTFNSQSRFITFTMLIAFSSLIFLISDLDSPYRGFLKVPQTPMQDLLKKIELSTEPYTNPRK
jgi:hypothetical protein